jgi:hypothetical protein
MDLNHRPPGPEPENQKFISAAPGVAYGIAGHLFPLLNWTEDGRIRAQRLTNSGPRSSPQRVAGMVRRAYADASVAFATLRLTEHGTVRFAKGAPAPLEPQRVKGLKVQDVTRVFWLRGTRSW